MPTPSSRQNSQQSESQCQPRQFCSPHYHTHKTTTTQQSKKPTTEQSNNTLFVTSCWLTGVWALTQCPYVKKCVLFCEHVKDRTLSWGFSFDYITWELRLTWFSFFIYLHATASWFQKHSTERASSKCTQPASPKQFPKPIPQFFEYDLEQEDAVLLFYPQWFKQGKKKKHKQTKSIPTWDFQIKSL